MEHSINPKKIAADLVSFMDDDSSILFITTEIPPADVNEQKTNWWYINPRVGHISFYTDEALKLLFKPYGLQMIHIETHTHILFKKWPIWASQFLPPQYAPQ